MVCVFTRGTLPDPADDGNLKTRDEAVKIRFAAEDISGSGISVTASIPSVTGGSSH